MNSSKKIYVNQRVFQKHLNFSKSVAHIDLQRELSVDIHRWEKEGVVGIKNAWKKILDLKSFLFIIQKVFIRKIRVGIIKMPANRNVGKLKFKRRRFFCLHLNKKTTKAITGEK